MPPIDIKDTTTSAANQQETITKEPTKLPPAPVLPSQVCCVISLIILVTIATGRATFTAGCYVR